MSRKFEDFMDFVSAFDDPEAPDGAWQAMIMDAVREYNKQFGTRIDPHEGFLRYVTHLDPEDR